LDEYRKQYEQEWQSTARELKCLELAERYHRETEAYDRTVCTGPIRDGSVMPIGLKGEGDLADHGVSTV
jgi:hypothetical protein